MHRFVLISCALFGSAVRAELPMVLANDHPLFPEPRLNAVAPAARAEPKADGQYEIDLLVLYTNGFASARVANGGAVTEVQRLISAANTFFMNSHMPVRYRAAAIQRYDGPQDLQDYPNTLALVRTDAKVQRLRDAVNADLVTLLISTDANNSVGGRASLFNGGEQSDPPGNVDTDRDAFSVVAMGPNASGFRGPDWLFAHELGHCMGGGHNFSAHAPSSPYWKTYAHALTCPISGDQVYPRSIMHAGLDAPGIGGVNAGVGDFFTSPALTADRRGCGLAGVDGVPGSGADNARSITEAAPYVAAYRGSAKDADEKTGRGLALGGFGFSAVVALLLLRSIKRRPAS